MGNDITNWISLIFSKLSPYGQEKHGTFPFPNLLDFCNKNPMREVSPSTFTLVYQLAWGFHRIDIPAYRPWESSNDVFLVTSDGEVS